MGTLKRMFMAQESANALRNTSGTFDNLEERLHVEQQARVQHEKARRQDSKRQVEPGDSSKVLEDELAGIIREESKRYLSPELKEEGGEDVTMDDATDGHATEKQTAQNKLRKTKKHGENARESNKKNSKSESGKRKADASSFTSAHEQQHEPNARDNVATEKRQLDMSDEVAASPAEEVKPAKKNKKQKALPGTQMLMTSWLKAAG
jgi:hypothetical protein